MRLFTIGENATIVPATEANLIAAINEVSSINWLRRLAVIVENKITGVLGTNVSKWVCAICGFENTSMEKLKRHVQLDHPEVPTNLWASECLAVTLGNLKAVEETLIMLKAKSKERAS